MAEEDVAGSPRWWLRRLDARLRKRQPSLKKWDDYYEGRHPLAFATSSYREEFAELLRPLCDNWMPLIVRSVRERLHVEGFQFGEDPKADRDADYIWQANVLDFESGLGHTEALTLGTAYGLVDPTVEVGARGVAQITVEHPSQMIVAHAAGNRRQRRAALKHWVDDDGRHLATVYLPERVWRFERGRAGWQLRTDVDAEVVNPLGVVPVVPLERRERLLKPPVSEFDNLMALQDATNKLLADMMIASEFAAFFQRWATGVEPDEDENGVETGEPLFRAGVDRLFTVESPEARFGQFQAADLSNYVTGIELVVRHMAALSSTPPHYLLGEMVNLSGDALTAAETGLVSKCRDRQRGFEEGWEELIGLAFRARSDARGEVVDAQTIWRDVESRSESQHVDAVVKKLATGVPVQQLWSELYSPAEVRRFRQMLREQAADRFLLGGAPAVISPAPAPAAPQPVLNGAGAAGAA